MPRRTFKGKKKSRKRALGFRARSKTKNGRRILAKRRRVGRRKLSV